ncbi:MAG: hypothetical protein V4710_08995 [Verrucomicrobiota bacterium]
MKNKPFFFLRVYPVLFTTLLAACSKGPSPAPPPESTYSNKAFKITLDAEGTIKANGKPILMDGLDRELAKLSPNSDTVWYYREGGIGELPPHSIEILESIVNNGLPIRFSVKPDFSDFMQPDQRPE